MWDKATSLARENDVSIRTSSRPQRTRRTPRHLDNSIVDYTIITSSATPVEEYKTQVYYNTIDVILEEMGDRFSELNLSFLTALEALVPTSDLFLGLPTLSPFLTHYNISETAVQSEAPFVRAFLRESRSSSSVSVQTTSSSSSASPVPMMNSSSLHMAYTELSKVPECFPTILSSYRIALTLGVSSASAERSFSSLRRIKTYLRSTMTQDRLSNLALLYIERDLSSLLWNRIDELVLSFAQLHKNSRIVLL